MRERWIWGALVALVLAWAAPAFASDPQRYSVDTESSGKSDVDAALAATAELVTLADQGPVPPFVLIGRARSDIPRLQTALDSFGYYQNEVTITIEGHALDDPNLPADLEALPEGSTASVKIAVKRGPRYRIGTVTIMGALSEENRQALGLNAGDPAIAARVIAARAKLLDKLQNEGYALAKVDGPEAIADDQNAQIDLSFTVTAGPQVDIGAISFHGLVRVREEFARQVLALSPGERYDPAKIEAARQALMELGAFSGVTVRAADHLAPDGTLPLTFDVVERPLHAVSVSGAYSTDLGVELSTTWSHRNLFGNAEQLNLTAATIGEGSATLGVGYNLIAQYVQPEFLAHRQSFEFDLSAIKQDLVAYNQRAESLAAYLHRIFSTTWKATVGVLLTEDDVTQEGSQHLYQLIALPLSVNYDSTGVTDPLLDTTRGWRATFSATPNRDFGAGNLTFFELQASASTYFDISGNGRSVFALRGFVADIIGGTNVSLPPDRRLYLGGSGTVRGFAYQTIGPLFPDGNPIGAKAADAGTLEFRQRFGAEWGAAAFVDAGQTSAAGDPFQGDIRVGAGAGVRYYTPIGAVRVDLALPITRIHRGDAFEVYVGLGQAF